MTLALRDAGASPGRDFLERCQDMQAFLGPLLERGEAEARCLHENMGLMDPRLLRWWLMVSELRAKESLSADAVEALGRVPGFRFHAPSWHVLRAFRRHRELAAAAKPLTGCPATCPGRAPAAAPSASPSREETPGAGSPPRVRLRQSQEERFQAMMALLERYVRVVGRAPLSEGDALARQEELDGRLQMDAAQAGGLGRWVAKCRHNRRKGSLSAARAERILAVAPGFFESPAQRRRTREAP